MTNKDSDPLWINARRTLAWGDRGEVEDKVNKQNLVRFYIGPRSRYKDEAGGKLVSLRF